MAVSGCKLFGHREQTGLVAWSLLLVLPLTEGPEAPGAGKNCWNASSVSVTYGR